jgi:microcystin-dependent protein
MRSRTHRIARCVTLAAALAAGAWSTASYACSAEDYLSTICVLAAPSTDWRNYAPADGRLLSISQNSALFALIGTTYGGNGTTTFGVPDLRGRFLLGAGNSNYGTNYLPGQVGGTPTVTLTTNQIPAHVHTLSAPLVLTGLTGSVNLGAATGGSSTVSLNGVTYNADTSKLALQAANSNAGSPSPTGAVLAIPATPANKIYSSSTPDVAMAAGAFTGGITVTANGTGTVTLAGTAPVVFGGAVTASGSTDPTGGSQPHSIMPPYVAMYYMIATSGLFPSRN